MSRPPRLRWTFGELQKLEAEYGKRPTELIAADLGRSPHAVSLKAQECGLKKTAAGRTASAALAQRRLAASRGLPGAGTRLSQLLQSFGGTP